MILKPEDFKQMLAWPSVLVTSQDKEGVANAASYGCVMPILHPLDLVSITSAYGRDTLNNIRKTKEFTFFAGRNSPRKLCNYSGKGSSC